MRLNLLISTIILSITAVMAVNTSFAQSNPCVTYKVTNNLPVAVQVNSSYRPQDFCRPPLTRITPEQTINILVKKNATGVISFDSFQQTAGTYRYSYFVEFFANQTPPNFSVNPLSSFSSASFSGNRSIYFCDAKLSRANNSCIVVTK